MKNLILTFVFLIALAVNAQAQKNIKSVSIKTSAVCDMCKATLEKDLTFEKGVKSVNLDVESKILLIDYVEGKTNPDLLRKRVTMVGYNADEMKRDPKAYEKLDPCCKDGAHDHDTPVKKKDGR